MLHDKMVLEQYLEKESMKIIIDKEKCKTLYNYMNDTYQIPKSLTADLISCRKAFSEVSEFILFCLLDSMISLKFINPPLIIRTNQQENLSPQHSMFLHTLAHQLNQNLLIQRRKLR